MKKEAYSNRAKFPAGHPQTVKAREDQVENYAGGMVFKADKWHILRRFLILGTEQPTYYAGAQELTYRSTQNLLDCLAEDGKRTVDEILLVSQLGLAPKNDHAIYALALCASSEQDHTRNYALRNLNKVARTGSHLLQFVSYIDSMRGWGRGLKNAINKWYESKGTAYQLLKYRNRFGWTHRDVLRCSHFNENETADPMVNSFSHIGNIIEYVVKGTVRDYGKLHKTDSEPLMIKMFDDIQRGELKLDSWLTLESNVRLPWEMLPTEWLGDLRTWEKLIRTNSLPVGTLLRNLGRLTHLGLFKDVEFILKVTAKIMDDQVMCSARLHPLSILNTYMTYNKGHGMRGKLEWTPTHEVKSALETAFYRSMNWTEPIGGKICVGLDVSGSVGWEDIAGYPMKVIDAEAALALTMAKAELGIDFFAFSHNYIPFSITGEERLADIIQRIDAMNYGNTDCSLPMLDALSRNAFYDLFIIITDNETWYGAVHPFEALQRYRNEINPNAKLAVFAMTATDFTIADPTDSGSLDIVGFDLSVPDVIRNFAQGRAQ